MKKKVKDGEGGGSYQIFEFIGLYVRYIFYKILWRNVSLKELSGEKDYPHIDEHQRIKCLIVGILTVILLLAGICFVIDKTGL